MDFHNFRRQGVWSNSFAYLCITLTLIDTEEVLSYEIDN